MKGVRMADEKRPDEAERVVRQSDDDVEGHKVTKVDMDDDVEGHKVTKVDMDDDDVEGHKVTK